MGRQENKLRQGIEELLDEGEELLGACIVAPRGFTKQTVAAAVPAAPNAMGSREQQRAGAAAGDAELRLAAPMGLAVTSRRLLTLEIGQPIGFGIGGKVRGILSSVPVAEVNSIAVKQIALRKNIVLTVRGSAIELEANAAAGTKELVEALDQAKARM